ncbi:MAG TPA: exodeoxyribonuclease VII small subunit [Thermoanaerobaculia bacterium]
MSEPKAPQEAPAPSFGEAMEELEEILQRIEGEEVDVDQLAAELRRASQLLDLARDKIRRAEVEVTQIVQGIEAAAEGGAAAPGATGGGEPEAGDAGEDDDEEDQDDIPF